MKRIFKKMNNFSKTLISILLGLILAVIILIAFASLMVKNDIPPDSIKYFWLALAAICGFISGCIAGRITESRGIIWGSITATAICFLILISLFIINSFSLSSFALIMIPIFVFFGALGGILSSNLRK